MKAATPSYTAIQGIGLASLYKAVQFSFRVLYRIVQNSGVISKFWQGKLWQIIFR